MANTSLQLTRTNFNPTPLDVYIAQRIIEGLPLHAVPHLPTELSLMILSLAAYQPRLGSHERIAKTYKANNFWRPGPTASVAGLYMTTPPLLHGCRVSWITVQIRAADQGWADFGGEGTYVNSHTWFEVSILRPLEGYTALTEPEEPLESVLNGTFPNPEDAEHDLRERGWQIVRSNGVTTWMVHHNVTACSEWRDYRVDWRAGVATEIQDPLAIGNGEGFLEALNSGDKIALWARAEEQAWVNKVAEATIEVGFDSQFSIVRHSELDGSS